MVKLNPGMGYQRALACLDGYTNITLEWTEKYVSGQLYGDAFIQENNVLYKSMQKRRM